MLEMGNKKGKVTILTEFSFTWVKIESQSINQTKQTANNKCYKLRKTKQADVVKCVWPATVDEVLFLKGDFRNNTWIRRLEPRRDADFIVKYSEKKNA